jgi:hypothetical protein
MTITSQEWQALPKSVKQLIKSYCRDGHPVRIDIDVYTNLPTIGELIEIAKRALPDDDDESFEGYLMLQELVNNL